MEIYLIGSLIACLLMSDHICDKMMFTEIDYEEVFITVAVATLLSWIFIVSYIINTIYNYFNENS